MSKPAPFEILRLAADTMRLSVRYDDIPNKRFINAVATWLDKSADEGWTGESLEVARTYLADTGTGVDA